MEPFSGSRLVELEALLHQHPDGLTSSELSEALEVDVSTIRRDLGRLSSTGVEIEKRGRRYYIGFHHATRSLRLTSDEALALYLANRVLSRQQSDRNPHTERVMQKLAQVVRDESPRFSNHIEAAASLQRSLPLHEGYLAVLETLTQAWSEGRVVHLSYHDQVGSITERNFHPFCIEPYGVTNDCYTVGFDELHQTIHIFKLNRILTADLTNEYFDIPPNFNPYRFFSEAWRVIWHDKPPQMVDLRFFGDAAQIVQGAFWHPSQRVFAQQDGTCRITFQVSEPLEMEPWILQWGASVEVITPSELRKAVVTNVHQLVEQYIEDNTSSYHHTQDTSSGEKGNVMVGYPSYYQRAIDTYEHGIKLVLGPTGLGKSSSIPDVVHANPDRKFVYMANRKQLLEEMAARFKPGEYVILRRDLEVVRDMLLTQRAAFEALLVDPRFKSYLEQAHQRSRLKSLEIVVIRRACQQVLEMTKEERILPDWLSRYADAQARIVLQAVRWVLQVTRDENEQGKVYSWLVNHPIVEFLFPAIPFRRRPEVRIMLVTLHKAYYGFFDGAQVRSLTDLSADKRLVVFLDEFDFLEHDLVTLICRGPQITDPFAFMANFYRAMAHHKLPKADFPLHPSIRKRIEKIVEIIEGVQRKGLNYPTINQFTLEKTSTPANQRFTPAVFRTQHIISTNPLYINQTDRAFQLETQPNNSNWLPARWLFNAVGTATTRTIGLLKEMERDEEVRYWEIMRQCFNNTDFFDQVAVIPRLPHQQQAQTTQRGSLLSEGYDLFDISALEQRTDNEEVEVQYYQMVQTPENLLHALAEKFLLFGLSATADLPRCLHHFDIDWFDKQGLLLPTTDEDRADIQLMNAQKAKQRGGHQMSVAIVDGLDKVNSFQERLSQFLEAVAHDDEFGKDTAGGHRSQRMHRFFSSLFWLLDQGGERPRQLLFLNTFHQVRLLFTTFARHAEEAGIYQVEPLPDTPWFDAFTLTIAQRRTTVVFFNAELATQVRQSKEAEQAFTRLFWTPDPVIVVTQYLSAGNGVNLQYTNEKGGPAQDFTHIGLLEAPYYFFTNPDPQEQPFEDVFAGRKENVWYQAKLFCAKLISEARFRQVLSTITRPGEWNTRYQQGTTAEDCLLNQLAIFIQALGRVERTWNETPAQVALFCPEVFRIFQAFMDDKYETIREQHAPFTSANLQAVFNDIARKTTSFEREARRKHDTRLRVINDLCRKAIGDLVIRLETVRSQGKDLAARHEWEALRRAVLRHDFHAEAVNRYHCTASSPYYAHGRLNLTPELDLLPLALTVPDSRIFHLDAAYAIISGNPVIRDHFLDQGYDLQFDHPSTHFFTPYCLQAILAGAIGEEAITALLNKEGITVEPLPDALFEIADLCIATKPWFIDCKNYNDLTLDRFSLPIDDPLWHPSLNEPSFTKHAQAKLDRILHHVGPDGKLIYINLVSGQERPLGYYTREFQKVTDFQEATIIVVQGALDRQHPNSYQSAFTMVLADLKKTLHPAEENEA